MQSKMSRLKHISFLIRKLRIVKEIMHQQFFKASSESRHIQYKRLDLLRLDHHKSCVTHTGVVHTSTSFEL